MTSATSKRNTRSRTLHGVPTPPCSPEAKETTLRSHLQNLFDELPYDLPTYYHEALLDDLCFLLASPLFLYAISPRIRRSKETAESSPHKTTIIRVPVSNDLHRKIIHDPNTTLDISKLRMEIKQDEKGWVTLLFYKTTTLIEGREYSPSKDTGFIPSFRFFCEELGFLGYEFRAREHAAAVACGMAVDNETGKKGAENSPGADNNKKRRLVKLKISFKMVRGKARKVVK